MPARRFPPPWSVEDIGAAFKVCDSTGQALAYVYFEEEPGRRSAAKLLSKMRREGLRPIQHAKVSLFLASSHPKADYKILT